MRFPSSPDGLSYRAPKTWWISSCLELTTSPSEKGELQSCSAVHHSLQSRRRAVHTEH